MSSRLRQGSTCKHKKSGTSSGSRLTKPLPEDATAVQISGRPFSSPPPAMAVRLWRRRLPLPWELKFLLQRCAAAGLVGPGGPRWASSSSSSSSSSSPPPNETSSKPQKKITDRLSAVIDAVNDRKLPPELRGQRNSVRCPNFHGSAHVHVLPFL